MGLSRGVGRVDQSGPGDPRGFEAHRRPRGNGLIVGDGIPGVPIAAAAENAPDIALPTHHSRRPNRGGPAGDEDEGGQEELAHRLLSVALATAAVSG